jgi:hypothetical protein
VVEESIRLSEIYEVPTLKTYGVESEKTKKTMERGV